MNIKTKQTLSILMGIGSVVGTIGTSLLIRKAAFKEESLRREIDYKHHHTDESYPSKKEFTKSILGIYLPSIIVGGITVGSIIGSSIMSHKAQASLISMAALADQGWRKYKNQVKSTLGLDTHNNIIKNIAKTNDPMLKQDLNDPRELYYEEHIGYFKAKPEDVNMAYAKINEFFNTEVVTMDQTTEMLSIGDFLNLLNAELIDNKINKRSLYEWGWTLEYLLDGFGFAWIHMNIVDEPTDDGVMDIKVISWLEEPILLTDYAGMYTSLTDDYFANGHLKLSQQDQETLVNGREELVGKKK